MDIKLLNAFVCVADTGHYGRAASTLCITQPALSKQIAALEATLGGRLLERGRHGAVLTPFGAAFVDDARGLVQSAHAVLQRAQQASRGERGRLRVGFGLSTLVLAPACVAQFCQRYPDVQLSLNDLPSAEQTRLLLAGQLDLGFVRLPTPAGLESLPMLNEQLALAVPAHSPWHTVPTDWADLNALGFAQLERQRGPGLAAQAEAWCASVGLQPRYGQAADDVQTVLALVAAGLACALLPLRSTQLQSQGVRLLPLAGEAATWQVGLAWRAQPENAVVQRFVAMARENFEQNRLFAP